MNRLPIAHIVQLVNQRMPSSQGIYVFGSFVQGQVTDESDVDVGLLLPPLLAKEWTLSESLDLQIELEQLLGRKVDLVNMRMASTVLQFEIINTGKRIFTQDILDVDLYELLTISLYQKFVEERRLIVEEGLRTGFYKI